MDGRQLPPRDQRTGKKLTFSYGPEQQRFRQVYVNGSMTETTEYVGGLLEKVTVGSAVDWRHYIAAEGQVIAIMSRKSSGTNVTRYVLEDPLQSVAQIVEANGAPYVSESFAAFGARRDASDWVGDCGCADLVKMRDVSRHGFTGHEMIGGASMGLIHMNGRVQDSITGRFLSADPYIQAPYFSQSLNRYSYTFNNPMSYTDPSGFANISPDSPGSFIDFTFYFSFGTFIPDLFGAQNNNWRASLPVAPATIQPTESIVDGNGLWSSIKEWWNAESTYRVCGVVCSKAWMGDPNGMFAPQSNTAKNRERVISAVSIATLPLVGLGATAGGAAQSSRALVPLGEWLYFNGTSRVVAGYNLIGNAGRVGATYNVNILGLGAQAGEARGFFALLNALRAEATSSGASRISIAGEWIAKKELIPFFARVAARFGLKLEVLTSAEGTAVTLSGAL